MNRKVMKASIKKELHEELEKITEKIVQKVKKKSSKKKAIEEENKRITTKKDVQLPGRGYKWQCMEDVPNSTAEAARRYAVLDGLLAKAVTKRRYEMQNMLH